MFENKEINPILDYGLKLRSQTRYFETINNKYFQKQSSDHQAEFLLCLLTGEYDQQYKNNFLKHLNIGQKEKHGDKDVDDITYKLLGINNENPDIILNLLSHSKAYYDALMPYRRILLISSTTLMQLIARLADKLGSNLSFPEGESFAVTYHDINEFLKPINEYLGPHSSVSDAGQGVTNSADIPDSIEFLYSKHKTNHKEVRPGETQYKIAKLLLKDVAAFETVLEQRPSTPFATAKPTTSMDKLPEVNPEEQGSPPLKYPR